MKIHYTDKRCKTVTPTIEDDKDNISETSHNVNENNEDEKHNFRGVIMTEYDIEKRVSEVFKETQLFEIPVRIVAIAQFYGFSVYKTNEMEDNESGLIIISEDIKNKYGTDKVIIFNKKHSVRRNRFTIAHETRPLFVA